MMEAVHHYEGAVNQVRGDEIMALLGAPLGRRLLKASSFSYGKATSQLPVIDRLTHLKAWIRRRLHMHLGGSGRIGPIALRSCAAEAFRSSLLRLQQAQPHRTAEGPVRQVVWELRLVSVWKSVVCNGDRGKV
jgi:class 3 adenylate cyclase